MLDGGCDVMISEEDQNQLFNFIPRIDPGTLLRLAREVLADAMEGAIEAPPHGVLTGARACRRRRVHPVRLRHNGLAGGDEVAGTAAANVVYGGRVLPQALLLGELLVEREDGALLFAVHVAGAAAAGGEVAIRGRRGELDAGGRTAGSCTVGDFLGIHASDVPGAAAAVVDG